MAVVRRWVARVAVVVAVLALVVMGVALLRWQQAERSADDAEAAASAAETQTKEARIEALEDLLRPGSVRALLDAYQHLSLAVCTDQHSPIEAMIEEGVAEASEPGKPLAAHEGWELALYPAAVQESRDRCSPGD